jgi:hypothetical protein
VSAPRDRPPAWRRAPASRRAKSFRPLTRSLASPASRRVSARARAWHRQIETTYAAGNAGRLKLHRLIDYTPALSKHISHSSVGFGAERRIVLRKQGFPSAAELAQGKEAFEQVGAALDEIAAAAAL